MNLRATSRHHMLLTATTLLALAGALVATAAAGPARLPSAPAIALAPARANSPTAPQLPPESPPGNAQPAPRTPPPESIDPSASCVSSSCHTGYNKGKYVHGPTALDLCTTCHVSEEPGKHRFHLMKEGPELCRFCHDAMPIRKVAHGPVAAGMCTACHDPHRSEFPFMLKSNPAGDLCFTCHDTERLRAKKHVHAPIVTGECLVCHDPHTSWYPSMLRKQGKDLCYSCHTEVRDTFEAQDHWHPPVQEDCVKCHDPHTSDQPKQLRDTVPELCWECHEDMHSRFAESTNIHQAVTINDKCLNCHDAHASKHPRVLKQSLLDTCLSCHDKEIDVGGRHPLANMKKLLSESKFLHGPIVQGNCVACHLPHAGTHFRRLKEEFPKQFYEDFDIGHYKLCFLCHDADLVKNEQTTTLTGFRDGDRNLHFVHVNRETKGRTCRACHALHGSNNPFHMTDTVPFGGWKLPVNYEKLDDGGRCAPGCHQKQEYHREKAVD